MMGKSSFEMVAGPLPTTLILACVAGDKAFVNAQKIHVSTVGTETKNFLSCGRFCQHFRHPKGVPTDKEFRVVVSEYLARLPSCRLRVRIPTSQEAHPGII